MSERAAKANRPEPASGERIAGKFRVERVVGRGGMGFVVAATNISLDQRVALKFLSASKNDPAVLARFDQEARASVKLRSEHVARIFDVDVDPVYGPFIVMELLEGQTLADVITNKGRLSVHRSAEYVIDACEGLAEAHSRGIIHQDVKPANLFLTTGSDGHSAIKLLDFGIAAVARDGNPIQRGSGGAAFGTPAYLAPEQLRGGATVDHRADLWALGCVLYELLTGEKAWPSKAFTELVSKILEADRAAIPEGLELPRGMIEIIDKCLRKDPEKRYTSMGELALALLPFARRRSHAVTTRAVEHVRSAGIDPNLQMPSSMPPRPSDPSVDLASSQSLRAPGVPRVDEDGPTSGPKSAERAISHSELPQQPNRSKAIVLAVAVLIAGIVGVVIALSGRLPSVTDKPTPEPSGSHSATTTVVSAPSASSAPSAAPSSAAPPGASAAATDVVDAGAPATPTTTAVHAPTAQAPYVPPVRNPAPRPAEPRPQPARTGSGGLDINNSR